MALQEMKKLKTGLAMKAAMNEGNLQKAFSLMLESGTIPDRIQGMPFGKSPPLAVVLASDLSFSQVSSWKRRA